MKLIFYSNRLLRQIFIVVLIVKSGCSGPLPFKDIPSAETFDFMRRYGYIDEGDGNSEALFTEDGLETVVREIQKFGAIPQTGKLDNQTLELMQKPRCGVPDISRKQRNKIKRFVLGPNGWNKRNITFFIANWSGKLSEESVAKYIALGLETWGRYGRLTFQRVYTPAADIIVAFGSGYHGDRYPFDGPGNILAHAYFPYEMESFGGDIHFDDDEKWTLNEDSPDGINFYQVAVHELGHSLGLSHSHIPGSVMFPYYTGNSPVNLDYDDILGMYELYIKRQISEDEKTAFTDSTSSSATEEYTFIPSTTTTTTESTTTDMFITSRWYPHQTTTLRTSKTEETTFSNPEQTTPPVTTTFYGHSDGHTVTVSYHNDWETVDDHKTHDPTHTLPTTNTPSFPDVCQGSYDAVATLRNEIFVFKDEYIWRLRKEFDVVPGYPIPFRQMFPKFPESVRKIDAVYQRPDGCIVFFAGKYFWVYDGSYFVENSPRELFHYGLPKSLLMVDAVQNWDRNKKTYIYRGDRFWRYNEETKSMDHGYPKPMDRWRGVPSYLDAATTWKGMTYFFKGRCHWKFNNDWIITTENSPSPTPQTWFGCPKEEMEYCVPENITP